MTQERSAQPVVSVVMLSYNHERYIEQAVRSVFMQTLPGVELVVADDASTDATPQLLRALADFSPVLMELILRDTNLGVQRNFADAWSRCRGQYIAILEGDDFWTDPDKLRKQVEAMTANPALTLSFHRVGSALADGTPHPSSWPPHPDQRAYDVADLARANVIQTCSVLYRAGVVTTLPPWFEQMAMNDWPLHLLHALAGPISYLPESMATYRFHDGGIWSGRGVGRRMLMSGRALVLFTERADAPDWVNRRLLATARRFGLIGLANLTLRHDIEGIRGVMQLLAATRPGRRRKEKHDE